MNRRLVLICNPGKPQNDNYIPQVINVLKRYRLYFQSPEGGLWTDDEIHTLPLNKDIVHDSLWMHNVIEEINFPNIDYSMIVFVGHGGVDKGQEKIQLSSGLLYNINYLLYGDLTPEQSSNIKRTVIIDACRSFAQPISIKISEDYERRPNGIQCRDYYNNLIKESSPHIELIQSTKYGDFAIATTEGTAFSNSLFEVIDENLGHWNQIALNGPNTYLRTIKDIGNMASKKMKIFEQVPEFSSFNNDSKTIESTFPFYAVSRKVELS